MASQSNDWVSVGKQVSAKKRLPKGAIEFLQTIGIPVKITKTANKGVSSKHPAAHIIRAVASTIVYDVQVPDLEIGANIVHPQAAHVTAPRHTACKDADAARFKRAAQLGMFKKGSKFTYCACAAPAYCDKCYGEDQHVLLRDVVYYLGDAYLSELADRCKSMMVMYWDFDKTTNGTLCNGECSIKELPDGKVECTWQDREDSDQSVYTHSVFHPDDIGQPYEFISCYAGYTTVIYGPDRIRIAKAIRKKALYAANSATPATIGKLVTVPAPAISPAKATSTEITMVVPEDNATTEQDTQTSSVASGSTTGSVKSSAPNNTLGEPSSLPSKGLQDMSDIEVRQYAMQLEKANKQLVVDVETLRNAIYLLEGPPPSCGESIAVGTDDYMPELSKLDIVMQTGDNEKIYDFLMSEWPNVSHHVRGLSTNSAGDMRAALTATLSRELTIDPKYFPRAVEAIALTIIKASTEVAYGTGVAAICEGAIHTSRVSATEGLLRVGFIDRVRHHVAPKVEKFIHENRQELIAVGLVVGVVATIKTCEVVRDVAKQIIHAKNEASLGIADLVVKRVVNTVKDVKTSSIYCITANTAAIGTTITAFGRNTLLRLGDNIKAMAPSSN
jgi:hypothetical protein